MRDKSSVKGIGGWLLMYLIASIPPMMVYAVGLSGAFFDYPPLLMLAGFLFFTVPLWLIVWKSPKAPRWNVAMLWIMTSLIALRSVGVFLLPSGGAESPVGGELLAVVAPLAGIVLFALGWAIVWTKYFRESVRVRNTFC
jgi:hypothetical protein